MEAIISRLRNSKLFKDSFWAVAGNGIGNLFMLLAGILIARFLGKEIYGEYGLVKTTMFLIALFATFGIGDTSTKFVADYIQIDIKCVRKIIISSLKIDIIFSVFLCLLLVLFSHPLAEFVKAPQLSTPFRFLAIIIVLRSLNTVGAGLLGGFKDYKRIGINNIISGLSMIVLCVLLTPSYSLPGALLSLLISQLLLVILNLNGVYLHYKKIPESSSKSFDNELICFSFPFAMNELIHVAAGWGCSLLLTKYSSLGELGIYTACTQWNAIILFMPGLLGNLILSYLSTTAGRDELAHKKLIHRMLLVNLICTVIPLLIVLAGSSYITSYYGPTFTGMGSVLCITIIGTVFQCMTRVYQSNLMSRGKKWTAFTIRSSYNITQLLIAFFVLALTGGINGARNMAIISVCINVLAFCLYWLEYKLETVKNR